MIAYTYNDLINKYPEAEQDIKNVKTIKFCSTFLYMFITAFLGLIIGVYLL